MNDSSVSEVTAKLDVLIRLVAIAVCGDRTQVEKIAVLHSAGLQPKEIGDLLGTTSNTVSVALSGIRKRGRSGQPRRGKHD